MKLKRTRLASVLIAAAFAALAWFVVPVRSQAPSSSDTSNQIVREKIHADKKALVAQNLRLTDSEAQAFWPLYEELQKAMTALGDRAARLIKEYADNYQNLPDTTAKKLTDDWLTIQGDRVKLLQSYLPKFEAVLPEKKVARYYQLENKVYAVVLYDLVKQIPLAK